MALITVILLGLILITLIGILLVCAGSLDNLQKQSESIHGILNDTQQSLEEKINNLTDKVEDLFNISRDIKYHQRELREKEMITAIETLKSIELELSDLKLLHDSLLSLKRSLEIIVAHPAFTAYYEDPNKNLTA